MVMNLISKSNDSKNYENNESQRKTINIITANQAISSLQTIRQFIESVKGINTSIFEAVGKLENFVNK